MMMTCRLLCALLVLALCCCPSVWVIAGEEGTVSGSTPNPTTPKEPVVEGPGTEAAPESGAPTLTDAAETEQPTGNLKPTPGVASGTASEGLQLASNAGGLKNTMGDADTRNTETATAPTPGSAPSPLEETTDFKKAGTEIKPNTTTNTPKVPTTTTTTTAPEATTTTTTTAAPTTTTTRAPSRLREIDGSLSSSAWVCAPLVLVVSALAYATLG
ncbi:putative mucin TcMUCII [Trypanosoma cruzi]|uniref:Mucin TcMUCII, putative n=2 Tax=Trypanosoma cruzi TaxID=5693 RepID=Q4D644_TRYCC|nr:mucin TcMUCII, putative [Trypanosoma cruzi]EAN88000.1 mucin TcMUCII, putative [Trypanosoma cruzi]PWV09729.1 putative mucin TcMUCII [Trypanosoma cruzi]|eukprot:XP_809851.1 mucin TcMUCII [Trypanosoma cruzi strain CL Brener]